MHTCSSWLLIILLICACTPIYNPLEEAYELHKQGRHLQALEELAVVGDLDWCQRETLKGDCYRELGMFEAALEAYYPLFDSCQVSADVYTNTGNCLYKLEKDTLAYICFLEAYRRDSMDHVHNYNLGLSEMNFYLDSAAKKHLKRAIRLSPKPKNNYYNVLIELYSDREEYDSAFLIARKLINRTSGQEQVKALLIQAFIYGDMQEYEKCIIEINKILEREELDEINRYNAYVNRYTSFAHLQDTASACADYRLILAEKLGQVTDLVGCKD